MKRLLTDIPQQFVLTEMLTPLKRSHNPVFQQINQNLIGNYPPWYQNLYANRDNDFANLNGFSVDFQSEYEGPE